MKLGVHVLAVVLFQTLASTATTIQVVPVHEPLSLHGTDIDGVILEPGEALQACVLARPKALTGAFPEVLIESIRSPHRLPTNNPNYHVPEANLLVLCGIAIAAESEKDGLHVRINAAQMSVPPEVDLTARQVIKLAIVAIHRTLEDYQAGQLNDLRVHLAIEASGPSRDHLEELATTFTVNGGGKSSAGSSENPKAEDP